MDIYTIIGKSPEAITKGIAERVKERRLALNLTQKAFARRAGVGYDAYRRFEGMGEITLKNLVLCAITLDEVDDFMRLFAGKSFQTMDDLLKSRDADKRRRGHRND